jgi:putative ABC transport system permease protein
VRYLLLALAPLKHRPMRALLTTTASIITFLLFALLSGLVLGLDGVLDTLSDTRVRVLNRAGPMQPLPIAYGQSISRIDHVRKVTHATLFGGYFKTPANPVSSAGIDIVDFLDVVPEIIISDKQLKSVLKSRTGAIVGSETAKRYHWQLGDRITLQSAFWTNNRGGEGWDFEILAINNAGPNDDKVFADGVFFDYRYLNESRIRHKNTVQHFIVAIDEPRQFATVARDIDGLFRNSFAETRSLSEKQWVSSQLRQVEDLREFVRLVIGSVFFSLLLLIGTMMIQSTKKRVPEFGILKSIGFKDGMIAMMIISEASVFLIGGACIALIAATFVFPPMYAFIGFVTLPLPPSIYWNALVIAAGSSVLTSLWPIQHLRGLSVSDAIAGR